MEYEKAFSEIKLTLAKLPILYSPKGKELILYVTSSNTVVNVVLTNKLESVREEQRPIFYPSKVLREVEQRYSQIEKALAAISGARRLRCYFQTYIIIVPTNYPLLQTLHKQDISGRLNKCAIELSNYNIKFVLEKAIKAQALSDFIGDHNPFSKEIHHEKWSIFVDGSISKSGCGASVVLKSQDGTKIEHALHFNFKANNNEGV